MTTRETFHYTLVLLTTVTILNRSIVVDVKRPRGARHGAHADGQLELRRYRPFSEPAVPSASRVLSPRSPRAGSNLSLTHPASYASVALSLSVWPPAPCLSGCSVKDCVFSDVNATLSDSRQSHSLPVRRSGRMRRSLHLDFQHVRSPHLIAHLM